MREKRNNLRPVTVNGKVKGYLLHIGLAGNIEGGIDQVVLVEEENGKVNQYNAWDIEFDDVEK